MRGISEVVGPNRHNHLIHTETRYVRIEPTPYTHQHTSYQRVSNEERECLQESCRQPWMVPLKCGDTPGCIGCIPRIAWFTNLFASILLLEFGHSYASSPNVGVPLMVTGALLLSVGILAPVIHAIWIKYHSSAETASLLPK